MSNNFRKTAVLKKIWLVNYETKDCTKKIEGPTCAEMSPEARFRFSNTFVSKIFPGL